MDEKIYSRFGGELRIIGVDPRYPDVPWLATEDIDEAGNPTGRTRWTSIADLKADGGWQTISLAATRAPIALYEKGKPPVIKADQRA